MKINTLNKKGFQISFAWLFAIIVGAFIIFLAIFASVKLIGTAQEISNVETGRELEVLANVLETGFESSNTASLKIALETRIGNNCKKPSSFEPFGTQGLQLAQKSLNRWSEVGTEIVFRNRYIFSEDITEGKKFFLFSKPFNFPFKVSSVIYLTSAEDNYCFIGLDENEEKEDDIKEPKESKDTQKVGVPTANYNTFGITYSVKANTVWNKKTQRWEQKDG